MKHKNGKYLGLGLVILFCLLVLVTAFRASERYYSRNIVLTDTSYFLMSVGILLQGRDEFGWRHVLSSPTPLHSSEYSVGDSDVYELHDLVAWLLKAVLPVRPSAAVILNGLWFIAMAVSLYLLLFERTGVWAIAALVAVSYLVANPYLPTVRFGLTSLDPNLHAFMIGTSAFCWLLLAHSFRKRGASIVFGVFLGLLVLARVYTLGIVLPAMLPFVVASFWVRSRDKLRASAAGAALALCALLAVCAWWLFPRLGMIAAYPTLYKDAGVLERSSAAESAVKWLRFSRQLAAANMPVICVLSWVFADQLFKYRPRPLRDASWSHLWVAICPLVILSWLGTTFEPYATLVLFGVFLTLLFPFRLGPPALLQEPVFIALLALATAIGAGGFFWSLAREHEAVAYDKRSLDGAIDAISQDAARTHRQRITLGLVHWGILHDASLIDALIFDAGIRIATPDYPPKARASTLVVDPLMRDLWVWDARLRGSASMTPELWSSELARRADYAIVLAADAEQQVRGGRWVPWVKASRLLLESPAFRVLAGPFTIPEDGNVVVLARR